MLPHRLDLVNVLLLDLAGGSCGRPPANIHLDLLGLGFLALRDAQRQHAILVIGLDGFGVHGVGKRKAAGERAISALHARIAFLIHFFLELAFTAGPRGQVLILRRAAEEILEQAVQLRVNYSN